MKHDLLALVVAELDAGRNLLDQPPLDRPTKCCPLGR
jgi:hypothetical protein